MKLQRLLHFRTNIKDRLPSGNNIELGEIAINYATNGETLFIKNNDNKIAQFKDTKYYSKITDDIYSKLDAIDSTPFFKNFATLAEYETAVANKEVVYPCVSYITEDNVIKFEKLVLTNKATVTITQQLLDLIGATDVVPLTANPDYYEIFEVNGEDYLSNTVIWEGQNVIPSPTFNLGDTFNIKFKLKDEPQYFIENTRDSNLTMLFVYNLSYLEIDESFYNRFTGTIKDSTVREYPVGFIMPSVAPDFTCKFKGNYGITDKVVSFYELSNLIYGSVAMVEQYKSIQFYCRLQIPSGNETYGKPSDMYDEDAQTGATFYGIINYLAQYYGNTFSNLHIIIETY